MAFAVAELPEALETRLTGEGWGVCRIAANPGDPKDAQDTVAEARRVEASWVVIDGDHFGSKYLETVSGAGFRVLLIDDFAGRKSYPVDLIVNPNLEEDDEPYRMRGAHAPVCMGISYVLLRREFRQADKSRKIRPEGNRILVTLGGSDPENLTARIVGALAGCAGLDVTAIMGAGFHQGEELRELAASQVRIVRDAANMVRS